MRAVIQVQGHRISIAGGRWSGQPAWLVRLARHAQMTADLGLGYYPDYDAAVAQHVARMLGGQVVQTTPP